MIKIAVNASISLPQLSKIIWLIPQRILAVKFYRYVGNLFLEPFWSYVGFSFFLSVTNKRGWFQQDEAT